MSDEPSSPAEIRFCPNCGTAVSPSGRFCVRCGFAFGGLGGASPGAPPGGPEAPFLPQQALRPSRWKRGMPIPLLPMRVGEMLDAAINLYRLHWKTFIGIVAFVLVPLTFLQSFLLRELPQGFSFDPPTPEITESEAVRVLVSVVGFGLVQFLFVVPFLTAAFSRASADAYLGGEPSVGETYRFAISRVRSILWVSFLIGLAVLGGVILLIIPAIIFGIRFTFSAIVVVVEGRRGTQAMRRSWRLSKGSFWKIVGTLLLAGILRGVVRGILGFPFTIAAAQVGSGGWILSAVGSSLAEIVTQPFYAIIGVLLYFDLRIRKEGFDLALMAQELTAATGEP